MHEVEKKYRIRREQVEQTRLWAHKLLANAVELNKMIVDFRYGISVHSQGVDFERLRVETYNGRNIYIYTHKFTKSGIRHEVEHEISHTEASALVGEVGMVLVKNRIQITGSLELPEIVLPHLTVDIDTVEGFDEVFVELEVLTADGALIPVLNSLIDVLASRAPIQLVPESRSMLDMSKLRKLTSI